MRRLASRLLVCIAVLFAALATRSAPAVGGEDPPFFCSMGNPHGREAFRVQRDQNADTGWMLVMYLDFHAEWWMPVSVSRNDEGKIVVYGRVREWLMRDRAFLGIIGEDGTGSEAEVRSLPRWQSDRYWDLRTAFCRPATPGALAR